MKIKDQLNSILTELGDMVDESYNRKKDERIEDGKHSVRTADTGSSPYRTIDSVLVGVHRRRTFSVTLYSSGEMIVTISCRSECRFKISSRTLFTRFNFLLGRKIRTGNENLDRKCVVRLQSRQDISGFLQRSDVLELIQYLMPFYLVSTEPETISVRKEYDYRSIRAGTLLELIERIADYANQIEEAFPCELDQEKEPS